MRIRGPSHATVVAYLALFAALGGSAYAVSKVGTNDLKRASVTSTKIRNHDVRAQDLVPIAVHTRQRAVAAGNTAMSDVVASCRKNEELITGAGGWIGDGNVTSLSGSKRTGAYQVRGTNPDGSADTLFAQAICIRK
jgi:hypothetical protein